MQPALFRDPSLEILPTLGPKGCKYYLHWAIWILRVWAPSMFHGPTKDAKRFTNLDSRPSSKPGWLFLASKPLPFSGRKVLSRHKTPGISRESNKPRQIATLPKKDKVTAQDGLKLLAPDLNMQKPLAQAGAATHISPCSCSSVAEVSSPRTLHLSKSLSHMTAPPHSSNILLVVYYNR